MARWFSFPNVDLPALAVTLTLCTTGGLITRWLGLPLGLMLGSLGTVAVAAAIGLRPLGHAISIPQSMRFFFVPVIGVAIGGAFTPAILAKIPGWWPSPLALCLYIPMAQFCGFLNDRRAGLSPATAVFLAFAPGGLTEMSLIALNLQMSVAYVTAHHVARIVLSVTLAKVISGRLLQ